MPKHNQPKNALKLSQLLQIVSIVIAVNSIFFFYYRQYPSEELRRDISVDGTFLDWYETKKKT